MSRLEIIMPPGEAVTYLVNLAVAVSLVCGVGLLAARLCRRGSVPLRHGVLVWTLVLVLVSPVAVWLAQQNGLALVRITVSNQPATHRAALADAGLSVGLPSPGTDRRLIGRGGSGEGDGDEVRDHQWSLADSPHPSPLPEGEGTFGLPRRNDIPQRTRSGAVVSRETSRFAFGDSTVSSSEKPAPPVWWQVMGGVVALLWAIGTAWGLVRLCWGCAALARFCRRLDPLTDPRQKLLVHQAADAVGLRKLPPVFLSPAAGVPVSIGLLRPAIVLPEAMPQEADDEQLQAVLLHEMAHIARHDHWVGVGERIAAVLFWWNPLVHWACDEISELREEICDNYVLLVQGAGRRLARILVDLAARATTGPLLPSTVGVLEPRLAGLTGRVLRLLDKERNMETRMNFRSKVLVFACGLAVLIGMATVGGLRLASAQPAASQAAVAEKPSPTSPARETSDEPKAVQQETPRMPNGQPIASDVSAVREELTKRFPTIDQDKLTEGAIRGMLKVLNDPYADLYSAKQMANVLSQLSGSMTGIGVVLVKEKGRIVVRDVIADSPAESAGLQVEDELQQINGQAVKGALDDVTKRIHGAAGTVVKLKVRKRDGKMVDLAIRRQPIHFSSVGGLWRDGQGQSRYWLDAERGLAYVQIVAVDQKVAGKTQKLIEQLKGQGLKGLVLDLRNCPGGTLQAIPKIVGLFQKEGRLLTINSTNGGRDFVYDSDGNCWMGDFPVVVLINGATTSAAEVIAGALQELGRAVLVGDRTCGKGSIQALVPVEGGEGLKVTVGEMLLPSGRRLQRVAGDPTWGVDPNDGFYVPLTAAGQQAAKAARQEFSRGQTTSPAKLTPELIQQKLADPQLAAAVRTLSAKVYGGQFAKVGQPLAALVAHYEQIRQRREHLLSQLKQLEGELGGSAE